MLTRSGRLNRFMLRKLGKQALWLVLRSGRKGSLWMGLKIGAKRGPRAVQSGVSQGSRAHSLVDFLNLSQAVLDCLHFFDCPRGNTNVFRSRRKRVPFGLMQHREGGNSCHFFPRDATVFPVKKIGHTLRRDVPPPLLSPHGQSTKAWHRTRALTTHTYDKRHHKLHGIPSFPPYA